MDESGKGVPKHKRFTPMPNRDVFDVDILFEMFVHPFSSQVWMILFFLECAMVQPFNFTFTDRREATHHFPSANFLGEGGFGPVYKVDNKLGPGLKAQIVAVKVLDTLGLRGYKEWLRVKFSCLMQKSCICDNESHQLMYEKARKQKADKVVSWLKEKKTLIEALLSP
ncbi:hypothetical protein RND71_006671 [Anisodus tanguticus]|uniref:Uncharacterized protein n=1 Tax=Anisodus tanguticus TaxID=243964 RepID=A0AAE1SUA0_9SOLA|nr:hypothetical protein RND71_006671 [Anisodus tanguticus]